MLILVNVRKGFTFGVHWLVEIGKSQAEEASKLGQPLEELDIPGEILNASDALSEDS